MNFQELSNTICGAPDQTKQRFYSLLAFDLTIRLRSLYGQENAILHFQAFNEIQHRLLGQILKLSTQTDRYADTQFLPMLMEMSKNHGISHALEQSLDVVTRQIL